MTRPAVIGLTGSIGMGKSTTLKMFAAHGLPVWDADAAVHRLYARGGAAVAPISHVRPEAILNGAVDRDLLKAWMREDADALPHIETIVHPLVAADREAFVVAQSSELVVVDVPLLFETGGAAHVDYVVVVTAPPEVQRRRVMARPGMTAELFETILAKQLPDVEKRARADYIVETIDMETAERQVTEVLQQIRRNKPLA